MKSCSGMIVCLPDARQPCLNEGTELIGGKMYCRWCAAPFKTAVEQAALRQAMAFRINNEGERLMPSYAGMHEQEKIKLGGCADFIHDVCGGDVKAIRISPAYYALACNRCNLRVVVSTVFDTFGGLRGFFKDTIGQ